MYKKKPPGPSRYTRTKRKKYIRERRETIDHHLKGQTTKYDVEKPKTRKRWSSAMIAPDEYRIVKFAEKRHKAERKKRLKEFKSGTHPQQWRVKTIIGPRKRLVGTLALLGPAGALGEDVILIIAKKLSLYQSNIIRLARMLYPKNSLIGYNIVSEMESFITYYIVRPLMRYLLNQIDRIVPVDSGDLRASLRNTLKYGGTVIPQAFSQTQATKGIFKGKPENAPKTRFPLRIVIGTPYLDYAKPVNNMPDEYLQHPGIHPTSIGSHTGYRLNDPFAKSHFYDKILARGRYRAKKFYGVFQDEVSKYLYNKYFKQFGYLSVSQIKKEINNMFTVLYK